MRKLTATLTLCLSLIAVPVSSASAANQHLKSRWKMIHKVNQVRAAHGLPKLRADRSLMRSSRGFSRHLLVTDTFAHRTRVSASGRFMRLGEALELHWGQSAGIDDTVRSWMNSPGHRAIVMTRSMSRIGVGLTVGYFRGERASTWVLQTGRP